MRCLFAILLCLPLLAQACVPERDDYGRIKRSKKVVTIFRATVPCPATGEVGKRCAGWIVDHRHALCVCGLDTVQNLQWMTAAAAKIKDRFECLPDWEKRLMEFELAQ
jgi:hypothetical protein